MAETFEGAAAMGPVADTEETPPGIAPTAESKYRLLKTRLKQVLEENVRLCDKVSAYQRRVSLLRKEKELLLDRLERDEAAARDFVVSHNQQLQAALQSHSHSNNHNLHHESDGSNSDVDASAEVHIPAPRTQQQLQQQQQHPNGFLPQHYFLPGNSVPRTPAPTQFLASPFAPPNVSFHLNQQQFFETPNGPVLAPIVPNPIGPVATPKPETAAKKPTRKRAKATTTPSAAVVSSPALLALGDAASTAAAVGGTPTAPATKAKTPRSRGKPKAQPAPEPNSATKASPAAVAPPAAPEEPLAKKPRVRRARKPPSMKIRKVQPVPRDESGAPILPFQVGIFTILSLGTIVHDRNTFHNERYIYPVGYSVSREYFSMKDPARIVRYVSTVLDGGEVPQFSITADDAPDEPIIRTSASQAWNIVSKVANGIRNRDPTNVSGPDYFGFTQPTIASLVQDLPNRALCKDYVVQSFELVAKGAVKKLSYKPDRKRPRGKKAGEVAADGSARGEGEADEANGDNADASGQSTPASSNRIMSEPWTGGDLPLTDPVTFGLGLSNSQEELGDGEDLEGDLDDMDDSIANEEEDGNRGETEEPSGQLSIPLPRDEPTSSIGDMDLA